MAQWLVIRLHPENPAAGADFTAYLQGLTITAYDLSTADPTNGAELGSASYVAPPNASQPWIPDPTAGIVQHFTTPPLPQLPAPEAVATAVIQITALPAGYKEYDTYDLRLVVTRGGVSIPESQLYYDVAVEPSPAPASSAFTTLPAADVALYLGIPAPISGGLAALDLGDDGTPPNYQTLYNAIQAVLAADQQPTPPAVLGSLTVDQATHIAYEILWATQNALPTPPSSSTASYDDLGAIYTNPPNDGSLTNSAEQNRQQFEGNLTSYYATVNAKVTRLAGYVYALSCAIACEAMAVATTKALLEFPVAPNISNPAATLDDAQVLLVAGSGSGPLVPAFDVPADYFYVLGAQLPTQVTAAQRFASAYRDDPARLLPLLTAAYDDGTIDPVPAINPAQAVRRLTALRPDSDTSAPTCPLDANVLPLVNAWLAYPASTPAPGPWRTYQAGDDDADFWTPNATALPLPYLHLVLCALTQDYQPLITAILAIPVGSVAALAALTLAQWTSLFEVDAQTSANTTSGSVLPFATAAQLAGLSAGMSASGTGVASTATVTAVSLVAPIGVTLSTPIIADVPQGTTISFTSPNLLPPFTAPGTFDSRLAAFIRYVEKFFALSLGTSTPPQPTDGGPSYFDLPTNDLIALFVAAYQSLVGGTFAFGAGPLVDAQVVAAIQSIALIASDPAAQAWLNQRVHAINALCSIAGVVSGTTLPEPPTIAFSLVEALYARGFTSAADVAALSLADFTAALRGTVAYDHAAALYSAAGGSGGLPTPPAPGPFQPVNPGTLVDCIPPCWRSPTGPTEYLHELLELSPASTCERPFAPPPSGAQTLGAAVASRRGPVGNLAVTAANADVDLPRVDLANENLEYLAATLSATPAGVVYDTTSSEPLAVAMPEHSSPAVPVAQPAAYANLRSDFSAPSLPYSQPLDVNRTYLDHVKTCRFETMRVAREQITEFALDPTVVAPTFQSQLWRYPVKLEIAIEYLGITPEELQLLFTQSIAATPTPGHLVLYQLYGFDTPTPGGVDWMQVVAVLPQFLRRTGLSYCELVELQRSGCFAFDVIDTGEQQQPPPRDNGNAVNGNDGGDGTRGRLPDCEPCCPEHLVLQFANPALELAELAVYLRLWRKLRDVCGARYTFAQLCDICSVLQLFVGGVVNPDFIRQLAAFQMLRDDLQLPLAGGSPPAAGATGADRTYLLALWVGPTAAKWSWAVGQLLDRVQHVAKRRHAGGDRSPHFIKLLGRNLDPLSRLAGFDPASATDNWHALPTHTLRFAEVLVKLCASRFSVGELIYLFTADPHLDGDDPFALPDPNECLDDPLALPEADSPHSLWALRRRVLDVEVTDEAAEAWTWQRVEHAMRELGYSVPSGGTDYLLSLGQHFFPSILEQAGVTVTAADRQYRTSLATTSPDMWNTPPDGPFRYDAAGKQLWTQLPLRDDAVIDKLEHIRALTSPAERDAVQNLYAAPRIDLAPFACLFPDYAEAERYLIESDERERWRWFRRHVAIAYGRCHAIAEHLAHHVAAATDHHRDGAHAEAALILSRLFADENHALSSWENDSGATPSVTWKPMPSGGAFAALLGLAGTGLLGELRRTDGAIAWRETRGPLDPFGHARDEHNAPAPTILPAIDLPASPQLGLAELRNGFAIADHHGRALGGAEGFTASWRGALLVERDGRYEFEGKDDGRGEGHGWRLTLRRGQRSWVVIDHHWPGEHGRVEAGLPLKRGVYEIELELVAPAPAFGHEPRAQYTGVGVRYAGPDTDGRMETIPARRLYRIDQNDSLASSIPFPEGSGAGKALALRYTSSLRDIRRTYQRAFKALLLAHRFELSAKPSPAYRQSELGYWLAHPDLFAGVSYYRDPSAFARHAAGFDFNFLPLLDPYHAPSAASDARVAPSLKREQALFDWWERLYDYTRMRRERAHALAHPVWLLFEEASELQPDDPAQLLRHLGVDLRTASLVTSCFTTQTTPVYKLAASDLEDDRWAVRAWHASRWCDRLVRHFAAKDISAARPDLWASDDPSLLVPGEIVVGNANLTAFLVDGCIHDGEPERYEDVARLTDGLRERARHALLAFLCGMSRVPLPWGSTATSPKDLSALLLLDVEAGLRERASRIDDAISAAQIFIARARLGLESSWPLTGAFARLWTSEFERYRTWETCKCRALYRENYVEWDELRAARRVEAFRFLEQELRRSTLTIPTPGGFEYWPETLPPVHPSVELLQHRDASALRLLSPAREGLGILGTQERDARPSWLAPDPSSATLVKQPPPSPVKGSTAAAAAGAAPVAADDDLPLWIKAAIRLGAKFVRVAAEGVVPASAEFHPHAHGARPTCCDVCGHDHEPRVDEFYFWLICGEKFAPVEQDEYYDPTQQVSTLWHDPASLPALLDWPTTTTARLAWCRIHNGELQQVRRSDDAITLLPGTTPDLVYVGRAGDSLTFSVSGAQTPVGYNGADEPGFRYDMPSDAAAPLPTVAALAAVPSPYPAGLPAYPFFAYAEPGARLFPSSVFSSGVAVAGVLRCHRRFEAALAWYRLVFDPLASDNTWIACKPAVTTTTPPPRDNAVVAEPPPSRTTPPTDTCCDSTKVGPDAIRRRAILLHYLETLVAWARALHRAGSRESAQLSRLVLDTAAQILGPCPQILENTRHPAQTVATFVPDNPPLNPRLLELYRHVKDGLSLVRRDESAARLRETTGPCATPYFGTDPCQCGPYGHDACCPSTVEPCCDPAELCCGPSPYRFTYLLQKALEAAGRVRDLGGALLGAFERGDAEYLASMRAQQDAEVADLNVRVRQEQWRDADWTIQALEKGKEVSQTNRRYYKSLIDAGLNDDELSYQSNSTTAIGLRTAAIPIEAVGEAMRLIPDMFVGFPCEETWLPLGSKLGEMFQAIARITNELAEISSSNAQLDLTEANWDRRLQDWDHQVEVLDLEIEQTEIQILAADRRRAQALGELNVQQRQHEQTRDVLDFARDKFSNHELYLYLQRETAALYAQQYELARELALEAERALNFELARGRHRFVPCDDWNTLHEGMLAGERLLLALQRADAEYTGCNKREYELTKHISLQTSFPLQLLRLKATGRCEIEIPEWMFDQDYPGHYMRRIRSVSLTVPCVTGPYTGVHCKLTLLRSATRVDPSLPCPVTRCCHDKPVGGCGCRHDLHEHYAPCARDGRLVHHYGASEAIATSTGRNDSGLFQLDFRDERRLPFEFRGAVSCWRIELPRENNYFDFDSLTDVVVQVNYTAREGGEPLREAAARAANEKLPGDGWVYLDLEKEFPDAWELLRREGARPDGHTTVRLPLSRRLFPFLPGDPQLRVDRVAVLFDCDDCDSPCPEPDGCACAHHDERARRMLHVGVERGRHRGTHVEIPCVRSAAWPSLYHGVGDLETAPIHRRGEPQALALTLHGDTCHLARAYVLLRYERVCECCPTVRGGGARSES